jgi:tetratricopeptide (TPR) repeat protein
MISPNQYIAERFPWLTRARAMAGAFVVALLIVFIWPHAHVVTELVLVTAIAGSVGALLWGLTYWSKARVQIGRVRLRYKTVRRIGGILALICLPFLLMQRASIYLRSPSPVTSEYEDVRCYVAVAHLEGDDGRRIEKRLMTALGSLDRRLGVTPAILDKTIAVAGRLQEFQHIEAVASVNNRVFSSLLWGGVKGVASPAVGPLYNTALFDEPQFGGAYLPVDFKLPELPLDDLSLVLQLVVATETAGAMEVWGYKFGDALEPVIKRARAMANDPHKTSGWSADTRARVNLAIGIAVQTSAIELIAEDSLHQANSFREATNSFHQANSYLEATQADWTREKNPLEWAMVQQNLAFTLKALALLNRQPTLLNEALTKYQNALQVYQTHSDQIDSANMQYQIGNALKDIGIDQAGTDSLRRAADCYRIAIKGFDPKRYSMNWAQAQVQLGSTLTALADRGNNPNEYEPAIAAFREALKVYNWDLSLTRWADTQVQLAEALQLLGEARSNVDDLKQSIALSREALEGFPRDRDPRRWAAIQGTIGNELLSLNDIKPDPAYAQQAAVALRASLEEQSVEHDPIAWATAKATLGNALVAMGESSNDADYFQQAIDAFNDALKVFKPDRDPVPWARTKSDLGDALSDLGMQGSGIRYLTEAVDNYHQALTVLTKDKLPGDWEKTQHNLQVALDELHQRGWKG